MRIIVKRFALIVLVTVLFISHVRCGADIQIIGDDLEGDHVCKEVEEWV